VEVISDDASRKARSIKDVTNYFETNHPELLGPLLKRTIVVMNQFNKLFTYKPPSKLEWLSSNNNDGLHSCLDELFQYLTLKYALSHPPFLVGFDYNKKQNTLGEDKVGYEREMCIGARDHLRPDLFAKLSVGLSQIHSIVLLSRKKIIKELVAQMKDSIRHHYQLLQDSIGSTVSIDEADVFNAVHQGFERFLSVVYYYANGVNFISARDINYLRFPYQSDDFTQEIATRFVDALYYVDEEKNLFRYLPRLERITILCWGQGYDRG
jgi:hypothetical protein